jgi:hypothetical protein
LNLSGLLGNCLLRYWKEKRIKLPLFIVIMTFHTIGAWRSFDALGKQAMPMREQGPPNA